MKGCTCVNATLCPQCAYYARRARGASRTVPVPAGPTESERTFQGRVLRAATDLGYRAYHTHDSRKSQEGWFDLALARANDKLVLCELKKAGEKQNAAQRDWYEDLQRITRVETYLWYPSDWDTIVTMLARKG